jgi:ActR/RegA family two-component response regulator
MESSPVERSCNTPPRATNSSPRRLTISRSLAARVIASALDDELAAIREEWPDARVVVLTTYKGDAQALRALKAGAIGHLLKSTLCTDLLEAIRSVHAGRRFILREIADELAAQRDRRPALGA